MSTPGERRSGAAATDAAILEVVRRRTETTRVEIAKELGVVPATVTYAVRRLLHADLVVETGYARSNGGKRASLLRLNDRARHAIGCTIDPGSLSLVGVDMTGALRSRVTLPLPPGSTPEEVTEHLRRGLDLLDPDRDSSAGTGIGFAVPGLLGHHGADLVDHLSDQLPLPSVRASTALCAALGSSWSGELPEEGLTATIHVDTALGLALLLDGRPVPASASSSQ